MVDAEKKIWGLKMNKIILIFAVVLLGGCSKQEAQDSHSAKASAVQNFIKKEITDDSQAAQIDYEQLVVVTHNALSELKQHEKNSEGVIQFLPTPMQSKFEPFQTWMSVKISSSAKSTKAWGSFTAEVYDKSYEKSKFMAFQACKEVWKNIDDRVPVVIDELAKRVTEYENSGSKPMTQHVRYGYMFDLDASHYKDGYPVVCQISHDR